MRTFRVCFPLLCFLLLISIKCRSAPQTPGNTRAAIADAQVIEGTTYINHTGHFTLTVPSDWLVTDSLIKTGASFIGTVKAPRGGVAIGIQRFNYPIGVQATAKFVEDGFLRGFRGYQKIGDTTLKIDGEDAPSFTFQYQAPPHSDIDLPGKMLMVFIKNADGVVEFMCEAPLGLFDQTEGTFESIVRSYHYSASL